MKIHQFPQRDLVKIWCNFVCAVISMPSRSHTSQKRWVSLVTLLRAIDVIRTAEDSTIIWRCVAIYYLAFIGTYVINVEKEKRKRKKNTRCLQRVTTQKCDSRRIEQFISIFMLQTITIILLILYFITHFFSLLLSFVWNDHIRHCDLSRGKNEQKKNRERKSVCVRMYVCARVCTYVSIHNSIGEREWKCMILVSEECKRKALRYQSFFVR